MSTLPTPIIGEANSLHLSQGRPSCRALCQPSQPQLLEKQIPFTCLKEDRVAERYVNKAERGERLPEIEARPTAYESKVPQPRTCIPSSNEL